MSENKNAKTPADGPEYERGFIDGMQRQMRLHVNRVIKTWHERCEEHPDHQERIISERMIQARMQEEIDELRQALETEQKPVAWMHNVIEGNVITHIPADIGRHPERWTPLYTAPPKREWVGLTDEERMDILLNLNWDKKLSHMDTALAIEAKLKERNG